MVRNTTPGSAPGGQLPGIELSSIGRLPDDDLVRILEGTGDQLDKEEVESHVAIEFWTELIGLLHAERTRRRREILELERMYFQR